MSRHLMARFRRESVGYDWQPGPTGWAEWAKAPGPNDTWKQWNLPEEHSSALVHHGEQRYALEVKPNRDGPDAGGPIPNHHKAWVWAIFKHGNDPNLEHDTEWTFPGSIAQDLPDSPAEYFGHAKSREEAQREAERNWELHRKGVGSGLEDYDLDAIMRDHDPRSSKPSYHFDDDFGDIFGGV